MEVKVELRKNDTTKVETKRTRNKLLFGAANSKSDRWNTTRKRGDVIEYSFWSDVMRRCLHQNFKDKHPEYADVSCDNRWLSFDYFMEEVFNEICDEHGFPPCKLHGLRMLNPKLFTLMPLSSADSTNIGRNVGIDKQWGDGKKQPRNKELRAAVMRDNIETFNGASCWRGWDYKVDNSLVSEFE